MTISPPTVGYWQGQETPRTNPDELARALGEVHKPVSLVTVSNKHGSGFGACLGGQTVFSKAKPPADAHPLLAYAPPCPPQQLGDGQFRRAFGLQYAYVVGAMANGITSVEMVSEAAQAGMIGFFGAAGLPPQKVEAAIDLLRKLGERPFGCNLIHSPNEPHLENTIVDLYLSKDVQRVSASAYIGLTLPLVRYRVSGIHEDAQGRVVCPNQLIAKISRVEVAQKFLRPPPANMLSELVQRGAISEVQAQLAGRVPMADALSAEADSGGHTDNRPALTLLPTILALRDRMLTQYDYANPVWVGLGGGIATPDSTAAAFAMGAAYVLTGSINQSCVEAGTSSLVRQMLSEARQADVIMAPAADMFEMGVKVQVLKRGTMFPMRAAKLYDLYSRYDNWTQIPPSQQASLERDYLRASFEETWQKTCDYFRARDPRQIERAEQNPKHKMALVFRAYLGQSSIWPIQGDPQRQLDYQIWCGPAMGAFNEWVRDTFLEAAHNRRTATVALNLMLGGAIKTRYQWLKTQWPELPASLGRFTPLPLETVQALLGSA